VTVFFKDLLQSLLKSARTADSVAEVFHLVVLMIEKMVGRRKVGVERHCRAPKNVGVP
jgi:hypothetical protein